MKATVNVFSLALLCAIVLPAITLQVTFAQQGERELDSIPPAQHQMIFADVQRGLTSGNAGLIARYFAPRVSVNLRGDESGTFSSSQTYYVLGDYLKGRHFAPFEFSAIGDADANPYATAETEFTVNGSKERVQVYVALSHVGEKYLITRLTIY